MPSLVVGKQMLMAVLNEARLHCIDTLTIKSLLYNIPLISIDLMNSQLAIVTSKDEIDSIIDKMRFQSENKVVDDLPDYYDLNTVIMDTVCIPKKAIQPIVEELSAIRARQSSPYRYPKQTCFAIDTNIAYNRLFSRLALHGELLDRLGVPIYDTRIIVTNIVEKELSRAVTSKYTAKEIEVLHSLIWDNVLVANLFNCCHKKGRKALNAQAEILALDRLYNLWKIGGMREESRDKEEVDEDIVSTLALHAQNQSLDMVFVTADDKSRAHAYGHKLPSVLVKFSPYPKGYVPFDSRSLVEMIHDLAVNFIGISVPELDLKVIGDWTGKSAADFHSEKVKLLLGGESTIAKDLVQDVAIVEALENIKNGHSFAKLT